MHSYWVIYRRRLLKANSLLGLLMAISFSRSEQVDSGVNRADQKDTYCLGGSCLRKYLAQPAIKVANSADMVELGHFVSVFQRSANLGHWLYWLANFPVISSFRSWLIVNPEDQSLAIVHRA